MTPKCAMARLGLDLRQQVTFLKEAQAKLDMTQRKMAGLCYVHRRTLSDWCRGKYRMRYDSAMRIAERSGFPRTPILIQVPDYSHVEMAGRLGAFKRNRLHGNPGTAEGRKLGGLISSSKFRQIGSNGVPSRFKTLKAVRRPEPSSTLAEFVGIMLGDGCLKSQWQVAISFNTETDDEYATFIARLIKELFALQPRTLHTPNSREGTLLVSSRSLVDCLTGLGLPRGDKVKVQADVPGWVFAHEEFRRRCLRGLIDTDGSVYSYTHAAYGRQYSHMAVCFTNRSLPLLRFVRETLEQRNYHPRQTGFHITLYRRKEIERYFTDVGTSNPKHRGRYRRFSESRGS